jgi:hypothetical protein
MKWYLKERDYRVLNIIEQKAGGSIAVGVGCRGSKQESENHKQTSSLHFKRLIACCLFS